MAKEIVPVWHRTTPELTAELSRFWIEQKALADESKAGARATLVVCVVREDGRIVGVSTARPRILRLLSQPMYSLKMYLAPEARDDSLSADLLNRSFEVIEAHELVNEKPQCLGVLVAIESPRLANHYNEAYWPRTRFAYAGVTSRNEVVRVRYFKGVRLPPPVKFKPKAAQAAPAAKAARAKPSAA
jgi:hypothetical protein